VFNAHHADTVPDVAYSIKTFVGCCESYCTQFDSLQL